MALLPPNCPEAPFDAKALGKALGLRKGKESRAASVLRMAGVLEIVGKRGNAYLYRCHEGIAGAENTKNTAFAAAEESI